MNATVLTCGYAIGGREGANSALAGFWRRIGDHAMKEPLKPSWLEQESRDPLPTTHWGTVDSGFRRNT